MEPHDNTTDGDGDNHSVRQALEDLTRSSDRDRLEGAAVQVVAAGDAAALRQLAYVFLQKDFLARLDDVADARDNTLHLGRVLAAMGRHPNQDTGAILIGLARAPKFLEIDERRIPLLPALAAVRPMTEDGAAIMKQAAAEGYYSTVIPLLVENQSPRALALFEALIRDAGVDADSRVADLHTALLPHRAEVEVLRSAERLLATPLEPAVAHGLLETIFDYRSREWFGPAVNPPLPPTWQAAPTEALQQVLYLAHQARARGLPPALASAVERTTETVHQILESRG